MGHARQGFQSFRNLAEHGQPLRRSEFLVRGDGNLVVAQGRCEDDEQNVLGIEAQVDVGEKKKATHHQACAYQKDNGETDLSDDQCGAKLSVARATVYAFTCACQLRLYVRARYTKSWGQTAVQRCEDSKGQSKK